MVFSSLETSSIMADTLAFAQTQFVAPVGADFGYTTTHDHISLTPTHIRTHSPRPCLPPPSPSPRFQPSPLPYLKQAPVSPGKVSLLQPSNLLHEQRSTTPASSIASSPCHQNNSSAQKEKTVVVVADDKQTSKADSPDVERGEEKEKERCGVVVIVEDNDEVKNKKTEKKNYKKTNLSKIHDKKGCEKHIKKETAHSDGEKERADDEANHNLKQKPFSSVTDLSLAVSRRTMGDSKENKSPRSSTSENLQTLSLKEHYDVERELGRGTYGKVVLARCRHTGTHVALKLLPKSSTKLRDFQREFQLSYFLSPHSSIIDTYNVAFETKSSFVFAQEHAPLGDLFDAIPPQVGMREADAKSVVKQLASALEFMHSKHLVHRDIKPENVLVLSSDFSRVKLMDFGMTRRHGTMVRKTNGSIPYTPPEVCEAVRNENIHVGTSADVWALGVLLFCMLTGNFPWENADIGDVYFKEFVLWQRRKTTKLPSQWRRFTPRAMKFFRKALDIKPDRRCEVREVYKYMTDVWTQKPRSANDSEEDSGSSASVDHMDELTSMLQDHGIETRVDRRLRERRISEWLLSL